MKGDGLDRARSIRAPRVQFSAARSVQFTPAANMGRLTSVSAAQLASYGVAPGDRARVLAMAELARRIADCTSLESKMD